MKNHCKATFMCYQGIASVENNVGFIKHYRMSIYRDFYAFYIQNYVILGYIDVKYCETICQCYILLQSEEIYESIEFLVIYFFAAVITTITYLFIYDYMNVRIH